MTGTQTTCSPDPRLKDEAIKAVEVLPFHPHFNVDKQPPYTDEDIEEMLVTVRREDILCTTPTCYSVTGSGNPGTACGSCCT
jgi:hypothetical protein